MRIGGMRREESLEGREGGRRKERKDERKREGKKGGSYYSLQRNTHGINLIIMTFQGGIGLISHDLVKNSTHAKGMEEPNMVRVIK